MYNYSEPYEIIEKLSDLSYMVLPYKCLESDKDNLEIVHVAKIKKYFPRHINSIKIRVGENANTTFVPSKRTMLRYTVDSIQKAIFCILAKVPKSERIQEFAGKTISIPHFAIPLLQKQRFLFA